MTQAEVTEKFHEIFEENIMALRESGQKEYAHKEDNAFANFERLADDLEMDRKKILWVYAMKHRDGIASFLNGYESQREDVRGRIQDLVVYLLLLHCMIDEEQEEDKNGPEYTI